MTALRAVVKDGKIELVVPPDWPDGTEVKIEPVYGPIGISLPARVYFDWRTFDPAIHFQEDGPFAEELATYGRHLNELLAHEGQYVLIKGREVVGIFPTQRAGLREAVERFGGEPAMVKEIEVLEPYVYLNSP